MERANTRDAYEVIVYAVRYTMVFHHIQQYNVSKAWKLWTVLTIRSTLLGWHHDPRHTIARALEFVIETLMNMGYIEERATLDNQFFPHLELLLDPRIRILQPRAPDEQRNDRMRLSKTPFKHTYQAAIMEGLRLAAIDKTTTPTNHPTDMLLARPRSFRISELGRSGGESSGGDNHHHTAPQPESSSRPNSIQRQSILEPIAAKLAAIRLQEDTVNHPPPAPRPRSATLAPRQDDSELVLRNTEEGLSTP